MSRARTFALVGLGSLGVAGVLALTGGVAAYNAWALRSAETGRPASPSSEPPVNAGPLVGAISFGALGVFALLAAFAATAHESPVAPE